MSLSFRAPLLALGLSLAFAGMAQASDETIHCVGTADELRAALAQAERDPGYDAIHVEIGRYEAADGDVAFAYRSAGRDMLRIEGGWMSVDGVRCAAKSFNAGDTVLSGGHRRGVLAIDVDAAPMIELRNFTLTAGRSERDAGGLRIVHRGTGIVDVRRLIVDGNHSDAGAGGVAIDVEGTLFFSGNLVSGNSCGTGGCAGRFTGNQKNAISGADLAAWQASTAGGNAVTGNTIVDNRCVPDRDACRAGGLVLGGTRMFVVSNDLFAFNDGADVLVATGSADDRTLGGANLRHSRYDRIDAEPGAALHEGDTNWVGDDPGFIAASEGDWRLRPDSPLRGRGSHVFGESDSYDLDGRPRQPGRRNVGVFEN